MFGDQLGDAAAHDVVSVAKSAGKNNELRGVERGGLQQGGRENLGRESSSLQGAGGFGITVGSGELDEQGVWHV
jgi:hypothetical protein